MKNNYRNHNNLSMDQYNKQIVTYLCTKSKYDRILAISNLNLRIHFDGRNLEWVLVKRLELLLVELLVALWAEL
jgi:hypothetical protein